MTKGLAGLGLTVEETWYGARCTGNVVSKVRDGSAAGLAGIKTGMKVLAVNGVDMVRSVRF